MKTQTKNLTYDQAMKCLLDGKATYIACNGSHIEDAMMIRAPSGMLIDTACFNEAEYKSHNWFIK